MPVSGGLITGAPAAQIAPFQNALGLQQPHRAVYGGERNPVIDGIGAAMQFIHIWVIGRLR